ncbi:MAG: BMP family ABC transporter substrate-binding protein, partial [Clostridiales bacterium]|nr:BMP family ABC transporter substrate-binding protein [Clostridiales bacterium]
EEAKMRASNENLAYVIGVDYDQYNDGNYAPGKSVVLTSMIKRLDSAVYNVCELAYKCHLNSGPLNFGIKEDVIGLPDVNPNISQEMNQKITGFEGQIISNEIIVPVVPSRLK